MSALPSLIRSCVPSTTVSPVGSVCALWWPWRPAAAGPEVAVVAGGAVPAPGRPLEVEVPAGAARVVAVVPGAPCAVAVVSGAAVDGVVTAGRPVVGDGAGAV